MSRAAWRGRVYLDAGLILYVGPGAEADKHAHNAVQLVWSLDGPFELTTGGRREERSVALIPANTEHTLNAAGHVIALLLVESHGARGVALDDLAKRQRSREPMIDAHMFPSQDLAAVDVAGWADRVLEALGVSAGRSQITSVTRRAIAHIERGLDGVPRVADVARSLSLSTSRLTHLFSSEVGIPFRRFVLWTRIKRAVASHQAGNDLTAAAIAAGFSDAAHFSRTFRSMFGLSPSLVLPVAEIAGTLWTEPGS